MSLKKTKDLDFCTGKKFTPPTCSSVSLNQYTPVYMALFCCFFPQKSLTPPNLRDKDPSEGIPLEGITQVEKGLKDHGVQPHP